MIIWIIESILALIISYIIAKRTRQKLSTTITYIVIGQLFVFNIFIWYNAIIWIMGYFNNEYVEMNVSTILGIISMIITIGSLIKCKE